MLRLNAIATTAQELRLRDMAQEPTDDDLLLAIAERRDRDAFAALHRRFLQLSFNVAYNITGNRSVAEEAVQEAMLQVWLSAKSYQPGNARGWIMRIVGRESLELARKQLKGKKRMEQERSRSSAATSAGTAEDAERGEVLLMLRRVLHELPALDRQLLALHFGAEMTQQEIGTALSMPQQTISFKIKKLLDGLRDRLAVAGFASVAPVLGAEWMNQAITSGVSAPHGLLAPAVSKFASKSSSLRTVARVAPKSASVLLPVAGTVIASVTLAGAIWMGSKDSGSNTTPPAAVATAEVSKLWSFDAGIPSDLGSKDDYGVGKWTWKKTPGGGELEGNQPLVVTLPVRTPDRPFVITAQLDVEGHKDISIAGASWRNERETMPHHEFVKTIIWHSGSVPERVELSVYFIGRNTFHMTNGVLTKICEFEKPYPTDKTVLLFKNCGLRGVSYRTLAPDDIPAGLKDTSKALQQLKANGAAASEIPPLDLRNHEDVRSPL